VWHCRRFGPGVLPAGGGIWDQEPGKLERMAICEDAFYSYYEFRHLEAGTGAKWQRSNPHKWEIVKEMLGL
jgi:hypothetical protein